MTTSWRVGHWVEIEGNIDNKIVIYDKSKLLRKIFDDYIIYEYDGKPFLKLPKEEKENKE